jgi:hypothetical protein
VLRTTSARVFWVRSRSRFAAVRSNQFGKIRADLSIYLFQGAKSSGQQLERVPTLVDRCRKAGIKNICNDFYSGGRYEMLNEINRDEVVTKLLCWISSVLTGKRTPLGEVNHSKVVVAQ